VQLEWCSPCPISNPLLMAITAAAGLIAYPLLHPAWVMVK
jgi:hypothetical protein